MLKKLRLTNFKAFGDPGLEIEPGLITVLIGPNGTGKSSVLQALLLLKQQRLQDTRLQASGSLINFGDYRHLVHNHEANLSMTLEFITNQNATYYYYLAKFSELGNVAHYFQDFPSESAASQVWRYPQPELVLDQSTRDTVQVLIDNFLFIPTMRGFFQLHYDPGGQTPLDMPYLESPEQWSRSTAALLAYKGPILRWVSPRVWRIISGGEHGMAKDWLHMPWTARDNRSVVTPESATEAPLLHEGFGSNQLVVLLTWLAFAKRQSIVGVEEPEIHLHPKAQGELAKVLAETAIQDRKQLILTTHSEHILTSLLIQVAAGLLKPEELAIYSFSRSEETDEAQAERLEITEKGSVKGGLRDFFEVERQEVDAYIQALSRHPQ